MIFFQKIILKINIALNKKKRVLYNYEIYIFSINLYFFDT